MNFLEKLFKAFVVFGFFIVYISQLISIFASNSLTIKIVHVLIFGGMTVLIAVFFQKKRIKGKKK
jgi:hypothetical protein